MRKSNLQLLQEAITAGNIEKAAELTAKLQKSAAKKKKPTTRQKRSPASKKINNPPIIEKETQEAAAMDECEYIASTQPIFTQKQLPRRVSMNQVEFVNSFNPDEYGSLPAKLNKMEKQIKKKVKQIPRPGQPNAMRDPVNKITRTCSICGDRIQVYPWEADTVDGQSSFRCHKRECVKAR